MTDIEQRTGPREEMHAVKSLSSMDFLDFATRIIRVCVCYMVGR